MQSWWQYGVRFGEPKFDIICGIRVNFHHSAASLFVYIANYSGHLVLLQSGKGVVLLIWITFKRIDSAILKLTLCCIKNLVVWNTCALKRTY